MTMTTLQSRTALVAVALLCVATPAAAKPEGWAVTPTAAPLPSVSGPIPVTPTSWPFAAADHSVTKRDLSKDGYVEEEYFISGQAQVYDWPALGQLKAFAKGPYTTRILIRRPKSKARFSGTVVVEALNPSIRYDAAVMWMESQDHFISRGDVYVGVTVKPVAAQSLKLFDPKRYAALSFANPLPPSETCAQAQLPPAPGGLPPESTPQTENGLIWDILSQVGVLIRSNAPGNPLRGWPASRVYLTGDSQSGAFVLIYANAIHPFATRQGGRPIYDGYLTASSGGPGVPIHQCDAGVRPGDPRMTMQPRGVPIMKLINQTDLGYLNRQPDSDAAPNLYRSYEVAGAAHVHDWVLKWGADDADVARTGAAGFLSNAPCQQAAETPNQFPTQYVLNAAWQNLDLWSRKGVAPPRAEPLQVGDPKQARATLALDEVGNAKGGYRTPLVDVPITRYAAYMDGPGICELWGYQTALRPAELKRLYPTRADFLANLKASTRKAVAERRLTARDGAALLKEAASAKIP